MSLLTWVGSWEVGNVERGILGDGADIGRVDLTTLVLSAAYVGPPPQGKAIYVYRAYIYG